MTCLLMQMWLKPTDLVMLNNEHATVVAAADFTQTPAKHQSVMKYEAFAVRPVVAGFVCVSAFIFGYSFSFGLHHSSTTPDPISHSTAAYNIRPGSSRMTAGMAERCSQGDINAQVELFKAAAGSGKSRWGAVLSN